MKPPPIAFYFDYISPYAYLASRRVEALGVRLGRTVEPIPVLFAALLNHFGHSGPAEIEPKRHWTFKQVLRRANRLGLPLEPPPHHPFNPLPALRLTLAAPETERWRIIHTLFEATWASGRGVDGAEPLRACIETLGLDADALLVRAATQPIKDELRALTQQAIARGVFGVPTCFVDGEVYWGDDSLDDMVADAAAGGPPQDERFERWLRIRPSASRRP